MHGELAVKYALLSLSVPLKLLIVTQNFHFSYIFLWPNMPIDQTYKSEPNLPQKAVQEAAAENSTVEVEAQDKPMMVMETELMEAVSELKTCCHIFGPLPSLEDLVNPPGVEASYELSKVLRKFEAQLRTMDLRMSTQQRLDGWLEAGASSLSLLAAALYAEIPGPWENHAIWTERVVPFKLQPGHGPVFVDQHSARLSEYPIRPLFIATDAIHDHQAAMGPVDWPTLLGIEILVLDHWEGRLRNPPTRRTYGFGFEKVMTRPAPISSTYFLGTRYAKREDGSSVGAVLA
ncbi:hypothetical protein EDB86DRAFT_3244227 [Lactarius hatsudake]|nr:hypothetical protein EDB86DRAFT_3244227 [Lactarius hatsudake]